jgi:hypothetical protein
MQQLNKITFFIVLLVLVTLPYDVQSKIYSIEDTANNGVSSIRFYGLADLKALHEVRDYEEFYNHINDILPSKRDKDWKELVLITTQNYFKDLKELGPFNKTTFKIMNGLLRYPFLKRDMFVNLHLNNYAKSYFKTCFKNATSNTLVKCALDAKLFWNNSNRDRTLGRALGELIDNKLNINISNAHTFAQVNESKIDTWEFYKPTTKGKFSDVACKQKKIQRVILNKLYSLFIAKEYDRMNYILFSKNCWNQVKPSINKLLISNHLIDRNVAFHTLKNTGEITQIESDLFYLNYILGTPAKSNEFNQAWNNIKHLGKDFRRRANLLKEIKKNYLLPDKILDLASNEKVKVIFTHLSSNFPEYFDLYFKKCYSYYSGKGNFTQKNPTLRCRSLFNKSKNQDWLTKSQIFDLSQVLPLSL